ncbi:MAG: CBS domain-containing protein [bacterium]
MRAQDIMTTKIISVRPTTSIVSVAKLMDQYGIHGVPVISENNFLKGIITESDFFIKKLPNFYLPSYINFLNDLGFPDKIPKKEQSKLKKVIDAAAEDIMTKNCVSILPAIELNKIIGIFKSKHIYTLPVVDETKKIVGVITIADIIKLFNKY